MILKAGNKQLSTYNDVHLQLNYEGVASAFSFVFLFDPGNAEQKDMFRPGSFTPVTIEHDGELLLTGMILASEFNSSATKQLVRVSGYSKTGVLEDCEIPVSAYPLQQNKLTLKQIAEKIIKPFGLKLVIDNSVSNEANKVIAKSTSDDNQTVRSYLTALANNRQVIVSHTAKGELLFTREQVNQAPVYHFDGSFPAINMNLFFDGQRMHDKISLIKQATKRGKGNAGQTTISNPYVSVFRPTVKRQTSGKDVDTGMGARNILSAELKGIELTIELDRWSINGNLVKPNQVITVTNPELHIYNKAKFFIAGVTYKGNQEAQTAVLKCVLPEVYNGDTPKNIFA